jgi:hypothetical protein
MMLSQCEIKIEFIDLKKIDFYFVSIIKAYLTVLSNVLLNNYLSIG